MPQKTLESTKKSGLQASFVVLLLLAIISTILYAQFLLDPAIISNPFLYGILLFVELYIILQTIGNWWTILYADYNPTQDHVYVEHYKELLKTAELNGGVDVFVTTYGEDVEIIRKTVIAARDMYVNHKTYILDDGKSELVKQLALELGVGYIIRSGNKNQKAGNINNGLAGTSAQFFAVFDADHEPKKNFLLETLPFFWDEHVAFVQTPQVLKNHNNIFSAGSSYAQKLFYDLVGRGKNRFNSMFWVGTNAVFRRKAIDEVGGIYLHTSEDILTSYQLHQKEWKSIYIPRELSNGLGPDSLQSYMKQQFRWAGGGFTLLLKMNPLFNPRLTIDQRIQYFLTSIFYFQGFIVLAMIIFPLFFIFFGEKAVNADGYSWAIRYIPYLLFQFITILILTSKFSWQAFVLSINSFPAYIRAFFQVFNNKAAVWEVTGSSSTKSSSKLSFLWPHIVLAFLGVLALPLAFLRTEDTGTTLFSAFWVLLNTLSLLSFIYFSLKETS